MIGDWLVRLLVFCKDLERSGIIDRLRRAVSFVDLLSSTTSKDFERIFWVDLDLPPIAFDRRIIGVHFILIDIYSASFLREPT